MKKAHGIMGALAVLILLADILMFLFIDHPYKSEPVKIFTEAFGRDQSDE